MKKLIALLLCLALSLALFACASDEPATTAAPETTTEEATATEIETTTEPETTEEEVLKNDPEAMALAFVAAYYGAEYDEMCETIYPDLIDDEFKETFLQIMEDFEASDFTVSDLAVLEKERRSDEDRASYEQDLNDEYGLSLTLDDLYFVTVEYLFTGDYDGEHYETMTSATVAVAQIGGRWYVVNGDESQHFGYDTVERAALVYFEGYRLCNYDEMISAIYPDVYSAHGDEIREEFEAYLEREEEYKDEYKDFAVSDMELCSREICEEWEQIYLEEYGIEIVISELYNVLISYRSVGTYEGRDFDIACEHLLPVAKIDGVWYVPGVLAIVENPR